MFRDALFYAKLAVAFMSVALAFLSGYHLRALEAKADLAKEVQLAQAARAKVEADLNVTSGKYEAERERTAQVQVDRVNTVREVYRNVPAPPPSCAVPDGVVRMLLGAVQDANAAATTGQSGVPLQSAPSPAKQPGI